MERSGRGPVSFESSHEELRDLVPAAALGALDDMDLRRVMAHTQGCAECAGLLSEYREVTVALAALLPPGEVPHHHSLRGRILARAREDRRRTGFHGAAAVNMWMGWAVAAGLAGVLLMHHAVHRPLDFGWLTAGALALALVGTAVYARIQRHRALELHGRLAALDRDVTAPAGVPGGDDDRLN